jgi:hypothetical protein
MKRISLFLSDQQVEAFQTLAKARGRPYAELIRDVLDDHMRRREIVAAKKSERPRAGTRKRS